MNIYWVLFGLTIFIPGILALYSASKLGKFLKLSGSIIPFIFSLLNGIWDTLFSILIIILALLGKLNVQLDFKNILSVVIIFSVVFLYISTRVSSSMLSMFLSGVLSEEKIRNVFIKFEKFNYEVKSNIYDKWEYLFSKFIKKENNNDTNK